MDYIRTATINKSYIEANNLPADLIGALRSVRRETVDKVAFYSNKKLLWVPKDQVEFRSVEREHDAALVEFVRCPTNILGLCKTAEEWFDSNFKSPMFLPGKELPVVGYRMVEDYSFEGEGDRPFYVFYQFAGNIEAPAFMFQVLPSPEFNNRDFATFITKFNIAAFIERVSNWFEITYVTKSGLFVTRETFTGKSKYTVRRASRGQMTRVSQFGEFDTEAQAIQFLERQE